MARMDDQPALFRLGANPNSGKGLGMGGTPNLPTLSRFEARDQET